MPKLINGFHIKKEAWYYIPDVEREDYPEVTVGKYSSDGGCLFEFRFVDESPIGTRLKMFDDAYVALVEFGSFFDGLARLSATKENVSLNDIVALLKEEGFEDLTERKMPKD